MLQLSLIFFSGPSNCNHHSHRMVLYTTLNCFIPAKHLEQCLSLSTVWVYVIKSGITTVITNCRKNTGVIDGHHLLKPNSWLVLSVFSLHLTKQVTLFLLKYHIFPCIMYTYVLCQTFRKNILFQFLILFLFMLRYLCFLL